MTKFYYTWGLILGFLLLLIVPASADNILKIDGTGDSQELLRSLAEAFEIANSGIQIDVPDSIGSSGGVKSLIKGNCDLARIARPLKEKERRQAADLDYLIFAHSPIVFTANLPNQCISNLTSEQLIGIFNGSITNWSKFGACPDNKIYVAQREDGDSSRSVIEKNIPVIAEISELSGETIYSTPETVAIIEENAFTFGYLPQSIALNHNLQTFSFNGVPATADNILNSSYPLTSPFGLVWKGELSGLASKFVDFIFSPAGQKIILDAKLVPTAIK